MIDLNTSPDKLRKSILQKAMQGKLTQQLSEDGNAADLLQSIAEERQYLYKTHKIKKSNNLLTINNNEKPFDIPNNWDWSRLGSLVDINSGLSYKKSSLSNNHSDIRIIRGGNISNNYRLLLKDNDYRINDKFINNANVFLKENQLIMPVSTSPKHTAKVAIVPHIDSKIAAGGFIYQITSFLYKNILSKFLMYDLSCASVNKSIKDSTRLSGSALCNLPKTKLRNIIVPIPPLSEQKRIVTKLDKILPKVDSFKQSVDHIQTLRSELPPRLRRSFLQEAMQGKLTQQLPEDGDAANLLQSISKEKQHLYKAGKIKKPKKLAAITDDEIPFKIPDNWQWVKLGNIINLRIGKTPPRHNPKYWNGNIPWVSVKDMNNGILNSTNEGITKKAANEKFKNKIVPKGTMLMSFKLSIGKVCILGQPAYHNEAIISLNFYKYEEDMKQYLFRIIKFLTKFAKSKNAIEGQTLNKTSLSNMLIPLPPLEEQKRIVAKLDSLLSKINRI